MRRCETIVEVIREVMKILDDDRRANPDERDAEYFGTTANCSRADNFQREECHRKC